MNLEKWSPLRAPHRFNPFREMEELHDRLARMFELTPLRSGARKHQVIPNDWSPLIDILENDSGYLIKVELPEVRREEVKISLEDRVLTISGERKFHPEDKHWKLHRIERAYGCFLRSFTMPEEVIGSRILADFDGGILRVNVPKNKTVKPKPQEIKVS